MKWDAMLYLLLTLCLSLVNLCFAFIETGGCNRTVRNSVGWIHWTGRMGRCIVRIRAAPLRDPQVITLNIRKLQVGVLKNGRCEGAYIQLFDKIEHSDEDVGRYCGHGISNSTRSISHKGLDLTIVMSSETQFAAENPVMFSAQFSISAISDRLREPSSLSHNCSLECTQRNDRKTCRLVSPGYPGVYPRGIKCRVALKSSSGRFRIGGDPKDVYNLMNYTHQDSCSTENCEAHVERDRTRGDAMKRSSRSLHDIDESKAAINHDVLKSQRHRIKKHRRKLKTLRTKLNAKIPYTAEAYKKDKAVDLSDNLPKDHLNRLRHNGHLQEKQDFLWSNKKESLQTRSNNDREDKPKKLQKIFEKPVTSVFQPRYLKRYFIEGDLDSANCVGDYLTILENVNGRNFEISKFCGEGKIPQILSRSRNIIIEFYTRKDGTIMHDGFQLTLQEIEERELYSHNTNCEYLYTSSSKIKESIKSLNTWYPPNTLCSYQFYGKFAERVSIQLKIVRDDIHNNFEEPFRKNNSHNYCFGNEIAVYNGAHPNDSLLVWSYCDASHYDINNIQVPIVSSGSTLLIQYYSAKGSYDGQEFKYTISYKFIKRAQEMTRRRQVSSDETKVISLRPVNFSALNLTDSENCDCDISGRIGSFKSWFMVLVVLGVISFIGAVLTIVTLLAKCMKMRTVENKLLQTPKR